MKNSYLKFIIFLFSFIFIIIIGGISYQIIIKDSTQNLINECANTDDDNCINTALDTKNPNGLTIFKKQIIKNINVAIPKPCSEELYNYLNSLTNEQKSKLDSKIVKACSY